MIHPICIISNILKDRVDTIRVKLILLINCIPESVSIPIGNRGSIKKKKIKTH